MIMWLFISIIAYFLFAIVSLADKYVLAGPAHPKIYSFYIGCLGLLTLLFLPFVEFALPNPATLLLSVAAGAFFIIYSFFFYTALENFEASRVVPAIGGFLPIFSFCLTAIASRTIRILSLYEAASFAFLILGAVIINLEFKKKVTYKSLWTSLFCAALLSLYFFLSKQAYSAQTFWQGFILMRVGGFLCALVFLFDRKTRKEIFGGKTTFTKKTSKVFLSTQAIGAFAFILQNFAVFKAELKYLPIINALQGLQYVFIFILAALVPRKLQQELEEKTSKKAILQKLIAIFAISAGLSLIFFAK